MSIPIENIYFLLCYAWNKLEEKDIVDVHEEQSNDIIDLFAKVLINGTSYLLKKGLDRYYIEIEEEFKGVKGKLYLAQTYKKNLLSVKRTHCSFDEFSHNILHNQILTTTIYKLIRTDNLDEDLRDSLRNLFWKLADIDVIEIKDSTFNRVKLNRNNYFYDFLLQICRIIHENILIDENSGNYKFKDFIRDEDKMAKLFEQFVRNFYKLEMPGCRVGSTYINWQLNALNEESQNLLPRMQTDITIESKDEKFIIDTKYYKETLTSDKRYNVEKIHSDNLYQLFAYLKNVENISEVDKKCIGILLYPTIDKEVSLDYSHNEQKVLIRTINLNKHWKDIRANLLELIAE